MSFEAYLDSIKAKTGKDLDDFRALAAEKGLAGAGVKAGDVVAWLKQDFDLGHGHAMAIFAALKQDAAGGRKTGDQRIDKLFSGGKAVWRGLYDDLLRRARDFGDGVDVAPTDTYANLVRGKKKFAILQPSAGHLDIGVKRKGVAPTDRFAEAGTWNSMVTHRLRIQGEADVDAELIDWLRLAYEEAA